MGNGAIPVLESLEWGLGFIGGGDCYILPEDKTMVEEDEQILHYDPNPKDGELLKICNLKTFCNLISSLTPIYCPAQVRLMVNILSKEITVPDLLILITVIPKTLIHWVRLINLNTPKYTTELMSTLRTLLTFHQNYFRHNITTIYSMISKNEINKWLLNKNKFASIYKQSYQCLYEKKLKYKDNNYFEIVYIFFLYFTCRMNRRL